MERFLEWLAGLQPLTIYGITGLSTFVENVFPPTPSDVIAALGGFLTKRTAVDGVTVFLVAWLANLAGAVAVYLLARRYGRDFLATPLGQRLLPADAIIAMEREYLRFGVAGIFISRFLPGFRSFVAPFVGLVNLPPLRALIPMAAASAIWYAAIVWLGARLGQEWETITRFLGTLNRTLAIVALVLAGLVGYWLWRRGREAGPKRARLVRIVRRALGDTRDAAPSGVEGDLAEKGAAALLFELTHADPALSLEEREEIAGFLRESWGLRHGAGPTGAFPGPSPEDTREFASLFAGDYDRERRLELLVLLYRMGARHGTLTRHQERLMARAAQLLGLLPGDQAEARTRALAG